MISFPIKFSMLCKYFCLKFSINQVTAWRNFFLAYFHILVYFDYLIVFGCIFKMAIYIYIFCVNLKKLLGSFLSTAIFLLSAPTPYVSINIFKVFHHLFWLWLTLYSFYVLFLSIFLNIRNSFWFTWLSLHPYSLVNQVTPNVYLDTQKDPQDRDGTVPVLQELLTDGGEGWGRSMHMQKM